MDIIGRNKNFGLTLFFAISALFLAYVMIFAVYQAYREREYKKELAGVRVTIINSDGVVLMDTEKDPHTMPNHLQRHEVQQALQEGYGFDISRTSETDGERYFYSATYFPQSGQIIRSAIPYPGEKANGHITNRGYIILSVIIFLLLTAALFFYTRRVGRYVDSTIEDYRQKVRVAEEEKVRIKHDLTQNTAHELKTPLASINGYLETLASHPDLPPEQQKLFLDKCMSQAQRMTDLLSDMSTLTRMDNMQAALAEKHPVDITAIAEQAIEDVRPMLEQKQIVLACNMPPHLPAQGDYNLLYSVFRNILDNAILYSGCTEIRVNGNAQYEFSIADNGAGVEKEHLPRLFERFYRVDKGRSRAMGGTGLGLAIVKNAVALHGGTCCAENTRPHGLTIRFNIDNQ
ncbi:MAG: hypothetical protein IJS49_00795 [Paludibacteraceae bacterium]|nr:hypothetical protein [Paludibacteraceae bacterium]